MRQALQLVSSRRTRVALGGTLVVAAAIASAVNPKILPVVGALVAMYAGHLLSPVLYILSPVTSLLPSEFSDALVNWLRALVG